MVEHVEELCAELRAQALVNSGGLGEREIKIREAGAGKGVAAQVADGAGGGREEGCGVKELVGARGGGSVA